jgi:hypothetical protein
LYNEDAIHFHKTLKETCDRHDKRYYPDFKKWCDKYFYVEHRKETRGIGGIFFDDLDDKDPNEVFSFVKDACNAFLPCYLPIIMKRKVTSLKGPPNDRIHHTPKHKRNGSKYDGEDTLNSISSSIEELNSVFELQAPASNQSSCHFH